MNLAGLALLALLSASGFAVVQDIREQRTCSQSLLAPEISPIIDELARFWVRSLQKEGQLPALKVGLQEEFNKSVRDLAGRTSLPLDEILRAVDERKVRLVLNLGAQGSHLQSRQELQEQKEYSLLVPRYEIKHIFKQEERAVLSAAFNRRGTLLVTGSSDKKIELRSIDNLQQPIFSFEGHDERIRSVVFNRKGNRILTRSDDKTVKLWVTDQPGKPNATFKHKGELRSAIFTSKQNLILTVSGQSANLWNIENPKKPICSFYETKPARVIAAFFNHRKSRVLTVSNTGSVKHWDLHNPKEPINCLEGPVRASYCSAFFNYNGSRVLSLLEDKTVVLWDIDKPMDSIRYVGPHYRAVFNRNGTRILTGGHDGTARIWAVSNNCSPLATLKKQGGDLLCAAFSSDNSLILTASSNLTAILWKNIHAQQQGMP